MSSVVKDVFHDRVPQGLAKGTEREQGSDDGSGFQGFDAFGRPVDIREPQPEGELVKGEGQGDAKDDRDPQVPAGSTCG